MVQAVINLGDKEDKFLNVFKAKKGIKSKNEALNLILRDYENYIKREELKEELDTIVKEYKTKHPNRKMSVKEVDELLGL